MNVVECIVECIDQCPDGVTLCPKPAVIANAQGGVDSTCPPRPGVTECPEPSGQDVCTDLAGTECLSDDPSLNCLPSCVNVDGPIGLITALFCDCRNPKECHAGRAEHSARPRAVWPVERYAPPR